MSFQASSKAKLAVYQYFANELLTNEERLVITRAFKALDMNGNGELDYGDLKDGLIKYCPEIQYSEEHIKTVIKTINISNNGRKNHITYSQFCMAAINENVLVNKDKSRRMFHLFDFVIYLCF